MDINNFQSVFDANVEEEKAFDTMFGAEEDDELMAVVLGEEADDYDLDMNTIEDDETPKDLEKDLEVGKEIDAPKVDSSETVTTPDEVDSEKDTPGEQIACPTTGVADAVEKKEPDEEKIEDEIDKAENKVDIEEDAFLGALLGEETEIDYDTAPAAEEPDDPEAVGDSCKEGEGCEGGECEDKDSEIAPDDVPVVYDGETTPDENLDDTFSDEGEEDDDDDDDDDDLDEKCGEGVEEIEDNQTEELTQNEDETIGFEEKPDEEVGLESTNLDDIFVEESEAVAADDTTTEKEEDEIIQAAEDDAEMTDAEVEELIGDGEDDDELLDAILGE